MPCWTIDLQFAILATEDRVRGYSATHVASQDRGVSRIFRVGGSRAADPRGRTPLDGTRRHLHLPRLRGRAGHHAPALPQLRDRAGRRVRGRPLRSPLTRAARPAGVFLRSRGNLKDMERELGISYPTVRGRVDALVRALGLADGDEIEAEADRDAAVVTAEAPRGRPMPRRPSVAPSWSASPGARSRPTRPPRRCVSWAAGAERRGTLLPHPDDRTPIGRSGRLSIKVTSERRRPARRGRRDRSHPATFQIRAASDEEADRMFAEAQLRVERAMATCVSLSPKATRHWAAWSSASVRGRDRGLRPHGRHPPSRPS